MKKLTKKQLYDKIIDELAAIAFANGTDYAKLDADGDKSAYRPCVPEGKEKAVSQIKQGKEGIEITLYDKYKAIEMLRVLQGLNNLAEEETVKIIDDVSKKNFPPKL